MFTEWCVHGYAVWVCGMGMRYGSEVSEVRGEKLETKRRTGRQTEKEEDNKYITLFFCLSECVCVCVFLCICE